MVPLGSRRGEAGSLTVYLMVGSVLLAGGFFFWLSVKATPVEVEVVDGVAEPEGAPATVVATADFGMDPLAHLRTVIELHRLGVGTPLGDGAFFVGIPNNPQYLIKMLPDLVPIGGEVEARATVSVTGTVYAMSDSVADAWVASGAISAGDRVLALFAESFIEARAVSVTAPPQPDPN